MERKMNGQPGQKNGQRGPMRVERGGLDVRGRQRSMRRTPEELALHDDVQAAFGRLALTPRGVPVSRAAEAIIGGLQKPYASPARRVLEMKAAKMPARAIRELAVNVFARWVDQVLGDDPPTAPTGAAMPKPMLVTGEYERAA